MGATQLHSFGPTAINEAISQTHTRVGRGFVREIPYDKHQGHYCEPCGLPYRVEDVVALRDGSAHQADGSYRRPMTLKRFACRWHHAQGYR